MRFSCQRQISGSGAKFEQFITRGCPYENPESHVREAAGGLRLSPLGQIAYDDLASIPSHYQQIDLPIYIVMPNHVHTIIVI